MKIKWTTTIAAYTILSCAAFAQDSTTTVAISSTTVHGFAGISYGMDFALRNVDTYDVYKSKPLNRLISKYSFIDSLSLGRYEVLYLGLHEFPRTDSAVQQFFGVLDLTKGESYFLGTFRGKVPLGRNMPLHLKVSTGVAPGRLVRVLRKREILEAGQELIAYPPYTRDSLVLMPIW